MPIFTYNLFKKDLEKALEYRIPRLCHMKKRKTGLRAGLSIVIFQMELFVHCLSNCNSYSD